MQVRTREITEVRVRPQFTLQGGDDLAGSGSFDQGLVTRKIRSRSAAIRRCYERQLNSNPDLAGKIKIRFTIREVGSVSGTSATQNSTGSEALAGCVTRIIGAMRFSEGPEDGSVTYAYPFVFRAQR